MGNGINRGIDFDVDLSKRYLGIVEDVDDPLRLGRVKARISWLFGDIPAADLPWTCPKYSMFFGKDGLAGAFSTPKLNSIIEIEFNDNNIYAPEYHIIQELAQEVKDELAKEYLGTHVWGMDADADLKVYYTNNKGYTLFLKGSRINIANDNTITIEHATTSSVIELRGSTITMTADSQINSTAGTRIKQTAKEIWIDGAITKIGHAPQYSMCLGEPIFMVLKMMAETIDAKQYPTPGVTVAMVEQMKKLCLSDTVKVSK